MRYKINFDRVVNRLVPYYLGGRRLILFLQSCVSPLKSVNDEFSDWAKEMRIEASMTSQVFKFEWYLNRKFKKYFADPEQRIVIQNGLKFGTPIYHQSIADSLDYKPTVIYGEGEEGESAKFYYSDEIPDEMAVSFIVYCPALDMDVETGRLKAGISRSEFVGMLNYYIERYRISNKTYTIIFNDEGV